MPSGASDRTTGGRGPAPTRGPDSRGITVFGCESEEAALFRELCPGLGIVPWITPEPASVRSVLAARPNRCVSVSHKSDVSHDVLQVLRGVGAEHLSTRSVGVDHIDLQAASGLGIVVENVTYPPDGVADYTLMLILMAIRHAKETAHAVDRHDFQLASVPGRDLRDLTVGVVGIGNIGTAVIRRLQGFGCRVLACDDNRDTMEGAEVTSLPRLLSESDIVTLHVPLTTDSHHLIGREQIARMKQGAVLVNTGRGALVDSGTLLDALESRHLGGVALDVLEGEEGIFYLDRRTTPVDHQPLQRLLQLPNAIVTPHTAYYTRRALTEIVEQTLIHCLRFERSRAGEPAHDRDLVRR